MITNNKGRKRTSLVVEQMAEIGWTIERTEDPTVFWVPFLREWKSYSWARNCVKKGKKPTNQPISVE